MNKSLNISLFPRRSQAEAREQIWLDTLNSNKTSSYSRIIYENTPKDSYKKVRPMSAARPLTSK